MNRNKFAPVLFIVFNRPEITRESLKILRNAKVPKLYVSQDGPRINNSSDQEKCNKVRSIILDEIDWECEVLTNFNDYNLGCKEGVLNGINWFFENEEKGIILEDDIIVHCHFFKFCTEMLNKYEQQNSIIAIQGFNQFGQEHKSNEYFYARGFYPWGWATWREKWKLYNKNIKSSELNDYPEIYPKTVIKAISFNLDLIQSNLLDTWDTQFIAMQIKYNMYTITPFANLSTNIGVDGAHSSGNHKILDFKLGVLENDNFSSSYIIADNDKMNRQLWKEYEDFKLTIILKAFLLKAGLYPFIKKIYKKYKG